jgi:hypothetical protein
MSLLATQVQEVNYSLNSVNTSTPFTHPTNHIQESKPTIFENILFHGVAPLYYKSRVRLSFSIAEEFNPRYAMIRGLIEFHRSKHFSFQYNIKQRTIEIDTDESQLPELQLFLNNVSLWLQQELQFKNTLRMILQFEDEYKLKSAAMYSLLKKTTS